MNRPCSPTLSMVVAISGALLSLLGSFASGSAAQAASDDPLPPAIGEALQAGVPRIPG